MQRQNSQLLISYVDENKNYYAQMNLNLWDYLFCCHPKEVKIFIFIAFYLYLDTTAFSIDCTEPPKYFLRDDAEFNVWAFPHCLVLRYLHKEASKGQKRLKVFSKH